MRKIKVVDYNPLWSELFDIECAVLQNKLDNVAIAIHHIGSTSVPGLAAKPVIDILIEATSLDDLDALNEVMEDIGYEPRGENGIAGRRYFLKGGDERTHHIHAFAAGDSNITRHLSFQDYLRANKTIANEYAELKMRLAEKCNHDSKKYCDGKDRFVKTHETLALQKK